MTTSPELLTVDLTDDERNFIWQAMYQWQFSASRQPFPYQVLGLSSWEEFGELTYRLAHAVTDLEPLTELDWMRVLYLTECSWASDVVGSGLDFSIVTEFSDIDGLSLVRRLQRKIGRIARPELLFPNGGPDSQRRLVRVNAIDHGTGRPWPAKFVAGECRLHTE